MTDMITPNVPAIASRAAILGADMTIPPVALVVFTPCLFLASDSHGCCLVRGDAAIEWMSLIYVNRPRESEVHSADAWENPALSSSLVRYGAVVPGAGYRI